jgi:hypothetical protein
MVFGSYFFDVFDKNSFVVLYSVFGDFVCVQLLPFVEFVG